MACPYFEPVEPLERHRTVPLPLGDAYDGRCRAADNPWIPDRARLMRSCNLGYAVECPRFREAGGPHAVRFAVYSDDDRSVTLAFVVERDYLPHGYGRLEYRREAGEFVPPPPSALLARQARAYLDSYLRRKDPGR